jgi:polyhydroxyalkanoate synthesis regulator phasin
MPENFSQRDPKWANLKHGTSSKTIGETGCTISGLAYILNSYGYNETPATVNEKLTNNNGYAQGNLIIWQAVPKIWPKLQFIERGYTYDNAKVAADLPCLVEVRGDRIGAPGGKHWVVFIGNKQLLDPWTGSIKATSWFGTPTGYAIFRAAPVQQNVPEYKELYKIELDKNSDLTGKLETANHDLDLMRETKDALAHDLDAEKEALKMAKANHAAFVDRCADIVGSPHDEESVVKFLSNYGKVFDELDELKVKYQKEKDQHASDMAQTSQKLDEISKQLTDMEKRHELEKLDMEEKHKGEITTLKNQIKALQNEVQMTKAKNETYNVIGDFIKKVTKLFNRSKNAKPTGSANGADSNSQNS